MSGMKAKRIFLIVIWIRHCSFPSIKRRRRAGLSRLERNLAATSGSNPTSPTAKASQIPRPTIVAVAA
jgi:hypothetical protein